MAGLERDTKRSAARLPIRARSRGPLRGIAVVALAAGLALFVASADARGLLTGDAEAAAPWHSFAPAIDGRAAGAAEARAAAPRRSIQTGKPRNAGVQGPTFAKSKRPRRDGRAPTTPSSLGVTGSTPTAIALRWVASSDRVGVAGYGVYVNGQRAVKTRRTTHRLTGLACGTSYTLSVDAHDAARNRSAPVAVVGATGSCPDEDAPASPSGLVQTATSESSASFSWSPTKDNVGVAGYGIYQGSVRVARIAETAFTLTGLACGGTYTVAVDAHDAAGNRSAQTAVILRTSACPDREAPSAPGDLRRTGDGPASIQVEWAGSRDNVGVTGYAAYVNGVRAGTTGGTSFTFSGLDCGTRYTLGIEAVDAAGNRSPQTAVVLNTGSCPVPAPRTAPQPEPSPEAKPSSEAKPSPEKDGEAPTKPSDLSVGDTGRNAVAIAWGRSSDNVGVEGYRIYRDGIRVGGTSEPSFTVSGLDCGKSYTLSVDAVDAAGNDSDQASANVTTDECASESPDDTEAPETPSGLQVGSATETTLSASWTAANDNVGVAGYGVYLDGHRIGATSDTSFTVSGLECGRSYTIAVDAVDAAGNRSSGADAQGSTGECDASTPTSTPSPTPSPPPAPSDGEPPSTPSGLAVAQATQTSVSFTWKASTDNVGVLGYIVDQNGEKAGATEKTTYTLVGLTCGTSYTVGVRAYDAAGNQSDQASAVVATSACPVSPPPGGGGGDTEAPSTPSGLVVGSASQTTVSLSWDASRDNVGVAGYGVYKNGTRVDVSPDTHQTLTGLVCATTYSFGVDAEDAAGNRSPVATVSVATSPCAADTQPPSVPDNQTITGTTQTTIGMSWSASTDNVGVTGYHLYLNGRRVATVTGTSHTYTGLTCGTTYVVALEAADAAGNLSNRAFATAPPVTTAACDEPPAEDTEPPLVPPNVAVASASETSVTIAWGASSDNVGVTEYGAYLGSARVATTASTSHTFSGLECGTSYTVAVDAADAAGNRSEQASIVTTTSPCPDTERPTAPSNVVLANRTGTSLSISWTAATDNVGVVAYGTYRNGTLVGSPAQTSYTYWGLNCGTTYTLAVDAVDAAGNRSPATTVLLSTSPCSDTQPPTVPTGFRVTGTTATTISVAWNASTDNIGVAGYGRYSGGALIASDATQTHTFSGLACGTSYTLAVDAYDAAGNRSSKATLNASTSACAPAPGGGNVAVSPSGSDSNPCTPAAPCQSFSRAYQAARPGDTVAIAGGSYPSQRINNDPSKTSSEDVVFEPAAGAGVTVSGLYLGSVSGGQVGASHVTFRDLTIVNGHVSSVRNSDVTFQNFDAPNFYFNAAQDVLVSGGDWGPCTSTWGYCSNSKIDLSGSGWQENRNITIDGASFHDYRIGDPSHHYECLIVFSGTGITVRNSRFWNCEFYDIFFQHIAGDRVLGGITVANNWFDTPWNGQGSQSRVSALTFSNRGRPFTNVVVQGNAFHETTGAEWTSDGTHVPYVNFQVTGNRIGRTNGCYSSIVFSNNRFTNGTCGPSDTQGPLGYANPSHAPAWIWN